MPSTTPDPDGSRFQESRVTMNGRKCRDADEELIWTIGRLGRNLHRKMVRKGSLCFPSNSFHILVALVVRTPLASTYQCPTSASMHDPLQCRNEGTRRVYSARKGIPHMANQQSRFDRTRSPYCQRRSDADALTSRQHCRRSRLKYLGTKVGVELPSILLMRAVFVIGFSCINAM